MGSFGHACWKVSAVTDDEPLFQSADYDFELFEDGSWKCWADGVVVANGAFRRWEFDALAADLIRIDGIAAKRNSSNDRYGAQ